MTFQPSPTRGGGQGQQCPPPPPSSPSNSRRQSEMDAHPPPSHHQQQQQQHQIANLLQYAQSSYTTNPTDALGALMGALTLTTGSNNAAQHAMDRIRSELGDAVADCVGGSISNSGGGTSQQHHPMHQHQQNGHHHSSAMATGQMSEREMTLAAMEVVQQLLNDTSTILHSRGKQHILQQAMEDGSSVVCPKCGDMISRERWRQHSDYWCRAIEERKSCDEGGEMALDD